MELIATKSNAHDDEFVSDVMYADDFVCERNDEIYNAVFEAIRMVAKSDDDVEWDIGMIAEVADLIDDLLSERGIQTCRPWFDDFDLPCHESRNRCHYCNHRG